MRPRERKFSTEMAKIHHQGNSHGIEQNEHDSRNSTIMKYARIILIPDDATQTAYTNLASI